MTIYLKFFPNSVSDTIRTRNNVYIALVSYYMTYLVGFFTGTGQQSDYRLHLLYVVWVNVNVCPISLDINHIT